MSELWRALAAVRSIVGEAHVLADPEARRAVARATFATTNAPACVVRPATIAELQACVRGRGRARAGVSEQPRAQPRLWAPTRDGSVLLDLARLDRIGEVDRELDTVASDVPVAGRAVARIRLHDRARRPTPACWPTGSSAGSAADATGLARSGCVDGSLLRTAWIASRTRAAPGCRARRPDLASRACSFSHAWRSRAAVKAALSRARVVLLLPGADAEAAVAALAARLEAQGRPIAAARLHAYVTHPSNHALADATLYDEAARSRPSPRR